MLIQTARIWHHLYDGQEINPVKPLPELVIDQIPTLPLQFKLVLYAFDRISMSRINEIAKEFGMLGFLICSYIHKRDGRVMYVRFSEPA